MTETEEHKAIIRWFRQTWPEYAQSLRVSQSGGHVGKGQAAARRNALSRAMGRVDGEADIAILLPRGGYGALLIEHKSDEAKRGATEEQLDYIRYQNSIGNLAFVTKGVEMAKATISEYMEQ